MTGDDTSGFGDWQVPDDLSGLLDGTAGLDTLSPEATNKIWVVGDVGILDGMPYVCTVQVTDDVTIPLLRDAAQAYAWTVVQTAHRAHYMAAVFAQMKAVMGAGPHGESPEQMAMVALRQLMEDLPDIDQVATAPLRFLPVMTRDGMPKVRVSLPPHGEAQIVTGWTFDEALGHGVNVLSVAAVCDLDSAWRTVVARGFGAGEQRGRAAVVDLANFYPGEPVRVPGGPASVRTVTGPRPGQRPAGNGKGRKRRR